jgi:hypothetical protein
VLRFRLYLPDGSDVGVLDTLVPNWVPGETIVTDDGQRWFLLSTIPETEPDTPFDGYLEVQPLEGLAERRASTAS